MSTLQLEAQPRELVGQKVKQLRREGIIPVVVYGAVDKPVNLQIGERDLERTLQAGGTSQLVQLQVNDGTSHNVLMRDLQRHPVRRTLMHADFYAINMREKQQVAIPVVSVNNPEALVGGLMVLQALDNIEIEALPSDIPASIEVDITNLTLEESITVADLPAMDGIEIVTDTEETLFTMVASRITEAALAEEEAAAAEAAEGEGEGEAAEGEGEAAEGGE